MSVTGVWVVGALTDEDLMATLAEFASQPPPPGPGVGLAPGVEWWRGRGDADLFASGGDEARRLAAFFESVQDDSPVMERFRDAVMDCFPSEQGPGVFAAAARKASPSAALCYALGAEAALRLPGLFGDFLLDSAEVRVILPVAEEALALTGPRRDRTTARARQWLNDLGDDSEHDVDALLDGPLRVLRHAAANGFGAAGQWRWY
jgi:hypothetical protein